MSSTISTTPKIVISIEGNIGAGKSTLMNILKEKFSNAVYFIDEPVDEWTQMIGSDGKNLLETFYENMTRWSYSFQNIAYITRMNRLLSAIDSDKKVIIMDRSLDGDKNTFTKMLEEDGHINKLEMAAYNKWVDLFNTRFGNNILTKHIYLSCDPSIAHSRINKRSRNGEGGIPLEYLTRLHNCHEEWLNQKTNILKIDVNQDFIQDLEKINQVSNFISQHF
jgi:deoxyadenosine/deoxycytidine kinase